MPFSYDTELLRGEDDLPSLIRFGDGVGEGVFGSCISEGEYDTLTEERPCVNSVSLRFVERGALEGVSISCWWVFVGGWSWN